MDQEALVAEMRKLRNKLVHGGGPLTLLMLLSSDQNPSGNYWNLIVSSKRFDKKSRAEALREISTLISNQLIASGQHILRATVLRTNDPFVLAINHAFSAHDSAINLVNANVFGFDIPRAILLESHRPAA